MFQRVRNLVATVVTALVTVAALVVPGAASAHPLSGDDFSAGNIISNQEFFDSNPMSVRQIQSFLNRKLGSCGDSTTCLAVYSQDTFTREATSIHGDGVNPLCDQYDGANDETAATIIFKVQNACHISAKVILVTLQKEQGLITNTDPSTDKLRIAMGYACPDTAPCNAKYYGFYNQVYSAASQLRRYTDPASTFYASKPVGQISRIFYHPNASCGTKAVRIKNAATHALYLYTPYTPNAAALANLTGTGDSCSSYGNSNFWEYYQHWFNAKANLLYDVDQLGAAVTGDWGALTDDTDCTVTSNTCAIEYEHAVAQWDVLTHTDYAEGVIADVYRANGGRDGRLGPIVRTARDVDGGSHGDGQSQDFQNGVIYKSPDNSAHVVLDDVDTYYTDAGGPAGRLGWPIGDAVCNDAGCSQDFEGGYVMTDPDGEFHVLTGAIADFLKANGAIRSPWGLPLGDAESVDFGARGSGRTQEFENGTVYEHDGTAVLITPAMLPVLASVGGITEVGWPQAARTTEGGTIVQNFGAGRLVKTGDTQGVLIPNSLAAGLRKAGGLGGLLGLPVDDATEYSGRDGYTGLKQSFTGGVLVKGTPGIFAIPKPVWQKYRAANGAAGKHGWPKRKPNDTGTSWTQQFQRGTITAPR